MGCNVWRDKTEREGITKKNWNRREIEATRTFSNIGKKEWERYKRLIAEVGTQEIQRWLDAVDRVLGTILYQYPQKQKPWNLREVYISQRESGRTSTDNHRTTCTDWGKLWEGYWYAWWSLWPDKIQEAHLRTMKEISPIFEASDEKRLRKFQEMIEGHQKGLEAVGIEPKSYEMIMVPKLMRKLPLLIRAQIAKSRKDISKPLTWKEFMEALKKEVTILEDCKGEKRDEKPRYDRHKQEERKSEEKSRTWTTGQSLLVRKKDGCAYCLGDHEPGSCEKVTTVTKMKEVLRRYRRCFGCLRKGHITRDCKSKKACECGKGVITISPFVKRLYQLLLWELGNQTLWIKIVHELLTKQYW